MPSGKDIPNPYTRGLELYVEAKRGRNPDKLVLAAEKFDEAIIISRYYRGVIRVQLEDGDLEMGIRELLDTFESMLRPPLVGIYPASSTLRTLHQILDCAATNDLFVPAKPLDLHKEKVPGVDDIYNGIRSINEKGDLDPFMLRALHKHVGLYLRGLTSIKLGGKIV